LVTTRKPPAEAGGYDLTPVLTGICAKAHITRFSPAFAPKPHRARKKNVAHGFSRGSAIDIPTLVSAL
jgi:hypothetical protein